MYPLSKKTTGDIDALFPKKRTSSLPKRNRTNAFIPENRSRYKLISAIGQGVNGHVVKAKDHKTGKIVAAKYIKFNSTSFYKFKQIYREVAILRLLRNYPGSQEFTQQLLCVEGADLDFSIASTKEVSIVSEFIKGISLQEYLDKAERKEIVITRKEAITLISNLLKAVEFIHKIGILHRDIKPANLMVTKDLGVKIVDFGLARTVIHDVEQQEDNIPKTRDSRDYIAEILESERKTRKRCKRTMSPHVYARCYRPPEVAITEPYSFSADIWSVGCILAEIVRCSEYFQLPEEEPRQLFPACSNFPLTPDPFMMSSKTSSKDSLAEDDLTRVIIQVLGDPSRRDLSFVSRTRRLQILQSSFTGKERVDFSVKLKGAPRPIVSIISKCLQYNPYFRYSASLLLQSEAMATLTAELDECNSSSSESYCSPRSLQLPPRILLEVDAPDAFDYDLREPTRHSLHDLEKMLMKEIEFATCPP